MPDYVYDPKAKPLYLYGLPENVVATLVPKDIAGGAVAETETPAVDETFTDAVDAVAVDEVPVVPAAPRCATCRLDLATPADKRAHLKTDLHYYNLKAVARGQPPVDEDALDALLQELDESLSGEDDSDDDAPRSRDTLAMALQRASLAKEPRNEHEVDVDASEGDTRTTKARRAASAAAATLNPFVWFASPVLPPDHYFGMYRALLTAEEMGSGKHADKTWSERMASAISSRQLPPLSIAPPAKASGPVGSDTDTDADTARPKKNDTGLSIPANYDGRHMFLCMLGGGHFAAMVVALAPRRNRHAHVPMNREATVLAHKTFHRYTTRRKQGGSQAANDNAKGAAHSAGSTLRRYNEQALVDDVRALLLAWKPLIDTADLLFVRANGNTNQRALFGPYDGQVLSPRDARLRTFPFMTARATQKEIMRAYIELTRLKVRAIAPASTPASVAPSKEATDAEAQRQAQRQAQRRQAQQEAAEQARLDEEAEEQLLHTSQLQALARRSKVPALLAYLQTHALSADTFRFAPAGSAQNHHAPTLLHFAAAQNAPALVTALLVRARASPGVRNGDGKTPFELAGDRATRNAFRVARHELGDAAHDWDAAHVPPPLAKDEADAREARDRAEAQRVETERRRAEEARLRAQAPALKITAKTPAAAQKSAQELREEEQRGLTPQQRQRLERERRARAAEARMRQA